MNSRDMLNQQKEIALSVHLENNSEVKIKKFDLSLHRLGPKKENCGTCHANPYPLSQQKNVLFGAR